MPTPGPGIPKYSCTSTVLNGSANRFENADFAKNFSSIWLKTAIMKYAHRMLQKFFFSALEIALNSPTLKLRVITHYYTSVYCFTTSSEFLASLVIEPIALMCTFRLLLDLSSRKAVFAHYLYSSIQCLHLAMLPSPLAHYLARNF